MKSPSTPPPARAPWRDDVEVATRTHARGFDTEGQLSRLQRTLAAGVVVAGAAEAVRAGASAPATSVPPPAAVAPLPAASAPAAAAGAPVVQGLFGKLVIGLAVIGALGVGIARLRADAPAPAGDAAAAAPAPEEGASVASAEIAESVVGEPVVGEPVVAEPREPTPEPPPPTAQVSPRRIPAGPSSLSSSSPTPSTHPAAEPAPSSVAEETAQLAEVRATASNPARALALAEEGNRRFPGGIFGIEREVIAIGALSRLGRRAEARQRAEAFLARHPGSPFVARVRAAAGIEAPASVIAPSPTASGGATAHVQP